MAQRLTYDFLKELRELVEDRYDWREIAIKMKDGKPDFEVGSFRFIMNGSSVQDAMVEYLRDYDSVSLFNPSFLSSHTGIPSRVFEALQRNDEYDAITEVCEELMDYEEAAADALSLDGPGHFFAQYDGDTIEIGDYLAFRLY